MARKFSAAPALRPETSALLRPETSFPFPAGGALLLAKRWLTIRAEEREGLLTSRPRGRWDGTVSALRGFQEWSSGHGGLGYTGSRVWKMLQLRGFNRGPWRTDRVAVAPTWPPGRLERGRPAAAPAFFLFLYFLKNIFYRNIFLVSQFTVLYPCRAVGTYM